MSKKPENNTDEQVTDAEAGNHPFDPLGLNKAVMELTSNWLRNPDKLMQAQVNTWNSYMNLWTGSMNRWLGGEPEPVTQPHSDDRRFRHEAWEINPYFDFLKQSYLISAKTIMNALEHTEGMDDKTARKLEFYTRQFVDAMSPSNFALTNPEVLEAAFETRGDNLVNGLKNFVRDFDHQSGQLQISMTDKQAFELGKNVATTPGKIIFQNELMQLIQYSPSTNKVFKTPLLIVPPWINKFYVLDLQANNSFIKWCVDQGHTVFVISWVNPDASLRDTDFQDYVFKGLLTAIDQIEKATGEKQVNAIGYCIGGTLLSAALAYLTAKKKNRIKSATFFVTMIDFSEPGDLGVFIDEEQVNALEKQMNEKGFHDGRQMAMSFNLLRSNDLIWSFYINNYLLGKEPFPFDLLYWNSDSTRMPAKMHSTYLRKMYLENVFREKGGITVGDVSIDVRTIKTPSYFISTEDDHIAPWKSTYAGAQLFSGPVRFVLGKSGHIAGIVNPPEKNKYGYYTGKAVDVPADEWREEVENFEGSWWPDWNKWQKKYAGEKVPARKPGDGKLKVIEGAPGSYVKMKV